MKSILRSISEGNSGRLSKLLGRSKGLRVGPDQLANSLLEAVKQGKQECALSLLKAGTDPNCSDAEGRTPLYVLVENRGGDPVILRELLKAGASPNKATITLQQTALHAAARKGYQVAVRHLVHAGAKVNKQDAAGNTALMLSVKEGHLSNTKTLLQERADPNVANLQGETALHFAVKGKHLECGAILLDNGADPNVRDSRGLTPLYLACKSSNRDFLELLVNYRCDVNAQDNQSGKSILHWAVENGDADVVETLVKLGAEVNIRDKNWETPFLLALNLNRKDMVETLMRFKCDVTVTDKSLNTALHIVARDGRTPMIQLLLDAGISANFKGAAGLTPLMLASYGGFPQTVKKLLRCKASTALTDRHRANALIYALLSRGTDVDVVDIVKILVIFNCDINQGANLCHMLKTLEFTHKTTSDLEDRLYTPIEVAFLTGKTTAFMMLLKAGCNLNHFYCENLHYGYEFLGYPCDPGANWRVLRRLYKERKRIRSLKELCRRPALLALSKGTENTVNKLSLSDHLKAFLSYSDLTEIQHRYMRLEKDDDSWKSSTDSMNDGRAFTRGHQQRQTINLGSLRKRSAGRKSLSPSTFDEFAFLKSTHSASPSPDVTPHDSRSNTPDVINRSRNYSADVTPRHSRSTTPDSSSRNYRPTTPEISKHYRSSAPDGSLRYNRATTPDITSKYNRCTTPDITSRYNRCTTPDITSRYNRSVTPDITSKYNRSATNDTKGFRSDQPKSWSASLRSYKTSQPRTQTAPEPNKDRESFDRRPRISSSEGRDTGVKVASSVTNLAGEHRRGSSLNLSLRKSNRRKYGNLEEAKMQMLFGDSAPPSPVTPSSPTESLKKADEKPSIEVRETPRRRLEFWKTNPESPVVQRSVDKSPSSKTSGSTSSKSRIPRGPLSVSDDPVVSYVVLNPPRQKPHASHKTPATDSTSKSARSASPVLRQKSSEYNESKGTRDSVEPTSSDVSSVSSPIRTPHHSTSPSSSSTSSTTDLPVFDPYSPDLPTTPAEPRIARSLRGLPPPSDYTPPVRRKSANRARKFQPKLPDSHDTDNPVPTRPPRHLRGKPVGPSTSQSSDSGIDHTAELHNGVSGSSGLGHRQFGTNKPGVMQNNRTTSMTPKSDQLCISDEPDDLKRLSYIVSTSPPEKDITYQTTPSRSLDNNDKNIPNSIANLDSVSPLPQNLVGSRGSWRRSSGSRDYPSSSLREGSAVGMARLKSGDSWKDYGGLESTPVHVDVGQYTGSPVDALSPRSSTSASTDSGLPQSPETQARARSVITPPSTDQDNLNGITSYDDIPVGGNVEFKRNKFYSLLGSPTHSSDNISHSRQNGVDVNKNFENQSQFPGSNVYRTPNNRRSYDDWQLGGREETVYPFTRSKSCRKY